MINMKKQNFKPITVGKDSALMVFRARLDHDLGLGSSNGNSAKVSSQGNWDVFIAVGDRLIDAFSSTVANRYFV
jgi:hypothetical protein